MNPASSRTSNPWWPALAGAFLLLQGLSIVLRPPSLAASLMGILAAAVGVVLWVRLFPDARGSMVFSANPLRNGTPQSAPLAGPARIGVVVLLFSAALAGRAWMGGGDILFSLGAYGVCAILISFLEKRSDAFAPPARGAGDPLEWRIAPLGALLVVGAFFLFHRLSTWPDWLHNDGAMTLKAALGFLAGTFRTPFFAEWGDNPAFPSLLYAAAFRVLGVSLFAAALVPAVVTLLCLPYLYGWARFFLPRGPALLTALTFASSRWIIFFVRTPREVSLLPAFEAGALYHFTAALETGRRRDFALFAVFLALSLNTYLPSRALAVFFTVSLLALLVLRPRTLLAQGRQWALAAGVFAAAILPIASWYAAHPNALVSRLREVNVFTSMANEGNAGPLWRNTAETLRMFDVQGMGDPHFNLDALPMFPEPFGLLLWVGAAWCAWRVLLRLAAAEAFLAGGLVLTLLTTVLALPPAHPMRSIVCVPFALLLAAVGADRLMKSAGSLLPARWRRFWSGAALAALAVVYMSWNADVYFRRMPASRDLWSWCEGTHLLAGKTLASVPGDRDLYASVGYAGYNHEQVLAFPRTVGDLVPGKPLPVLGAGGRGAVLLVANEQEASLGPFIRAEHPGATRRIVKDRFGEERYFLYEVPPAAQEAP